MQPCFIARLWLWLGLSCLALLTHHHDVVAMNERDAATLAQAYGRAHPVVTAQWDGTIIAEAEEFQVTAPQVWGWQARNWGTNYYAATFSNTFLSRKAYLAAPEQCDRTVATRQVEVAQAGRYMVLVRYEAAPRFETRFRVQVEQNGDPVFVRQYGARENQKIWAYGKGIQAEVMWPWGAVENVVWEGHEAWVQLQPGRATISLIADRQPDPAARRHIDLVLLTPNADDIQMRLKKEEFLPLDGLLTQVGDMFVRVHNHRDDSILALTIPPGTEHSPYWVHLRSWRGKKKKLLLEPGKKTEWIEIGSFLDTLNDGQWKLQAKGYSHLEYTVEFGIKKGDRIRRFQEFKSNTSNLTLAYDANTRYTRRVRLQDQFLYDLVDYLKARPVTGQPPVKTRVYAHTFDAKPEDKTYMAARAEFVRLMGIIPSNDQALTRDSGLTGYIDVRRLRGEKLKAYLQDLKDKGLANNIAVVSLGDEIRLPRPKTVRNESFQAWLQATGVPLDDLIPDEEAADWSQVVYDVSESAAQTHPRFFYYSQRYLQAEGIRMMKAKTDLIREYLPKAGIGANFSPHHKGRFYLGETHKWLTLFREEGMTLPWSEDYAWQVPIGSPQMNMISLDMFRAGLKGKRNDNIHYYVMPHWPGNTPKMWRRHFYGDLGHGMKEVNLFELRPVQAAYTENHVNLPEMYLEIRRALHELGDFEDLLHAGRLQPGIAGLWFSETSDVWKDEQAPFAAAKRALYVGIRHQQLPLDMVTEHDAVTGGLKRYRVLYLTDRHVSRAATAAITTWVEAGGRLMLTAGAGMWDEFNQPNVPMQKLAGLSAVELVAPDGPSVNLIKQDLPYVQPLDTVTWFQGAQTLQFPVFEVQSRMTAGEADVHGFFQDGSAALTVNRVGKGKVLYSGFLPGLAYFRPAIPRRVLDRGATDDAMAHFLPTEFDPHALALIGWLASGIRRPITSSDALVETNLIRAQSGVLIPVVNWRPEPVRGLTITLQNPIPPGEVRLASGSPIQTVTQGGQTQLIFDLEVADAVVIRSNKD